MAQPLCWQNSVLQKSSYCRWSRHQVCPQMALLPVELNGMTYQACRGDFVVRLDGSTCLQL
ncbi:TPA: hypothetical protein KL715_002392 [Escherichia coli]|nr:hypothetical protein [Escherichia coli]HBE4187724.1 hypothetical protein [Escherichia coli]